MEATQTYKFLNEQIMPQVVGDSIILKEDLSNIVDVGRYIMENDLMEVYTKALHNKIGLTFFVDRIYNGMATSVLKTAFEFGMIMEKIQCMMPDAVENASWELEDKKSYDPNVFTKPKVSAKFFRSHTTFEIDISITEMQVKESFTSATQLSSFISMIYTSVANSATIKIDELIMRTINNFTAATLADSYPDGVYAGKTSRKAINLLTIYNERFNTTLDAEDALTTPEFLRFAVREMELHKVRLRKATKMYNIGEKVRFTGEGDLTTILMSEFIASTRYYLQADTYHSDLINVPSGDVVPYWQGPGKDFSFTSASSIDVVVQDDEGKNKEVKCSGILGVMFDKNALGVVNQSQRTTQNYNPKAEFTNIFYKYEMGFFNDFDENFLVFFVA